MRGHHTLRLDARNHEGCLPKRPTVLVKQKLIETALANAELPYGVSGQSHSPYRHLDAVLEPRREDRAPETYTLPNKNFPGKGIGERLEAERKLNEVQNKQNAQRMLKSTPVGRKVMGDAALTRARQEVHEAVSESAGGVHPWTTGRSLTQKQFVPTPCATVSKDRLKELDKMRALLDTESVASSISVNSVTKENQQLHLSKHPHCADVIHRTIIDTGVNVHRREVAAAPGRRAREERKNHLQRTVEALGSSEHERSRMETKKFLDSSHCPLHGTHPQHRHPILTHGTIDYPLPGAKSLSEAVVREQRQNFQRAQFALGQEPSVGPVPFASTLRGGPNKAALRREVGHHQQHQLPCRPMTVQGRGGPSQAARSNVSNASGLCSLVSAREHYTQQQQQQQQHSQVPVCKCCGNKCGGGYVSGGSVVSSCVLVRQKAYGNKKVGIELDLASQVSGVSSVCTCSVMSERDYLSRKQQLEALKHSKAPFAVDRPETIPNHVAVQMRDELLQKAKESDLDRRLLSCAQRDAEAMAADMDYMGSKLHQHEQHPPHYGAHQTNVGLKSGGIRAAELLNGKRDMSLLRKECETMDKAHAPVKCLNVHHQHHGGKRAGDEEVALYNRHMHQQFDEDRSAPLLEEQLADLELQREIMRSENREKEFQRKAEECIATEMAQSRSLYHTPSGRTLKRPKSATCLRELEKDNISVTTDEHYHLDAERAVELREALEQIGQGGNNSWDVYQKYHKEFPVDYPQLYGRLKDREIAEQVEARHNTKTLTRPMSAVALRPHHTNTNAHNNNNDTSVQSTVNNTQKAVMSEVAGARTMRSDTFLADPNLRVQEGDVIDGEVVDSWNKHRFSRHAMHRNASLRHHQQSLNENHNNNNDARLRHPEEVAAEEMHRGVEWRNIWAAKTPKVPQVPNAEGNRLTQHLHKLEELEKEARLRLMRSGRRSKALYDAEPITVQNLEQDKSKLSNPKTFFSKTAKDAYTWIQKSHNASNQLK